jgi:hypothetical protein
VDGAGGVGRDELEVHPHARVEGAGAVGLPRLDDHPGEGAGRGRFETDVEEAGTRDLDAGDTVHGPEALGQLGRELTRVRSDLLGQLHRDVGGPVAVVAVLGPFEHDVGESRLGVAPPSLHGVVDEGVQGGGELFGSHRGRFYRPGAAPPGLPRP